MTSDNSKGYILFIAALGVMFTLLSADLADLSNWDEVYSPRFVASAFSHIGTVIAAFVGGRLVNNRISTGDR